MLDTPHVKTAPMPRITKIGGLRTVLEIKASRLRQRNEVRIRHRVRRLDPEKLVAPQIAKTMGGDDIPARVLASIAPCLQMLRGDVAVHGPQAVVAEATLISTSGSPQVLKSKINPHWGTPKVDVAHHLAIVNQFNGATSRPYSGAEHSLLCCDIARRVGASVFVQLAALMHDAHEAYTSDLISPAKLAVNNLCMAVGVAAWTAFEAEHAQAVREHFKLLTAFAGHKALLRSIDLQALATARRDLTAYDAARHLPWPDLEDNSARPIAPAEWLRLDTPEREIATWKDWRDRFLERFARLHAQRNCWSPSASQQPAMRLHVMEDAPTNSTAKTSKRTHRATRNVK